eukprot:TRINITY_DN44898_c0_g1_i2.p1 TRINITY_DN44898_c0_g1~~TRINITY_DN44898_c0_g1_i2.p1  ORF type:complete len:588 (-),score=117.69 TRINITY_DN44898_c0_g1_i2:571-2334(-)
MSRQDRERRARWTEHNFYEVLGIARTSSAADIKKAFKRVALSCHPDKVPEAERESATKRFQLLAEAYEVLSNERTRWEYDNIRGSGGSSAPPQRPSPAPSPHSAPTAPAYRGGSAQQGGSHGGASAKTPYYRSSNPPAPPPKPKAYDFSQRAAGVSADVHCKRCEGCDRMVALTALRNCRACQAQGVLSAICQSCDMCALCAPDDEFGDFAWSQKKPASRQRPGAQSAHTAKAAPQAAAPTAAAAPKPQQAGGYERPRPPEAVLRAARAEVTKPKNKTSSGGTSTPPAPASKAAFASFQRQAAAPGQATASKATPDQQGASANAADASGTAGVIAQALVDMGYSENDAAIASTRCSSVEAAVAFLADGAQYDLSRRASWRETAEDLLERGKPTAFAAASSVATAGAAAMNIVGAAASVVGSAAADAASSAVSNMPSLVGMGLGETLEAAPRKAPLADAEDGDDAALSTVEILLALGFSEGDSKAAAARCSSVEAAVDYLMKAPPALQQGDRQQAAQAAEQTPGQLPPQPSSTAVASSTEHAAKSQPSGSSVVSELLAIGFSQAQAEAAAKRCSSLEAAVEWIMANPS